MVLFTPILETISPVMSGEIFPYFFTMEMFQCVIVTVVAGLLRTFLLIRNLALIDWSYLTCLSAELL